MVEPDAEPLLLSGASEADLTYVLAEFERLKSEGRCGRERPLALWRVGRLTLLGASVKTFLAGALGSVPLPLVAGIVMCVTMAGDPGMSSRSVQVLLVFGILFCTYAAFLLISYAMEASEVYSGLNTTLYVLTRKNLHRFFVGSSTGKFDMQVSGWLPLRTLDWIFVEEARTVGLPVFCNLVTYTKAQESVVLVTKQRSDLEHGDRQGSDLSSSTAASDGAAAVDSKGHVFFRHIKNKRRAKELTAPLPRELRMPVDEPRRAKELILDATKSL